MSHDPIEADPTLLGDQRRMVEAELEPGERLLWWARPLAGRLAIKTLPIILFGIPWTAFALFWMWGASGFGHTPKSDDAGPFRFFFLFGLPFVLIGLGMLSAPYWAWRKGQRTVYAVTDRRAIIFAASLWGSSNIRSFAPAALADLERKQRPDGSGDIIFCREVSPINTNNRTRQTEIGFVGVANVKQVETLLKALAQDAAPAPRANKDME